LLFSTSAVIATPAVEPALVTEVMTATKMLASI